MTVSRTTEQTGPATLSVFLSRTSPPTQQELLAQDDPSSKPVIEPPENPEPLSPSETLPTSFQAIRNVETSEDDAFKAKIPGPSPAQRVVEVDMKHKSEDEILADMLKITGGQEVEPTQGELDTLKELEEFRERSRKDSEMSNEVRAKWKREQEMLRQARGETA
jgi:large subunit ribosomal protein MRP49